MILHIPHSSFIIPPEVRARIILGEEDLKQELIRMTDAFTDELFDLDEPHQNVVYPDSRIVCDPERFLDNETEPMSKVGMGVVYTRTSDGRTLQSVLSDEERKKLIDRFYIPHHRILEKVVAAELAKDGRSLIVDCHSFPSKPLPGY
jgi:N-formylglutamate deformylase